MTTSRNLPLILSFVLFLGSIVALIFMGQRGIPVFILFLINFLYRVMTRRWR